ncbi:MAG: FG-GAP repeat domain-containing protein, partial [Marinirhabdus sp.]
MIYLSITGLFFLNCTSKENNPGTTAKKHFLLKNEAETNITFQNKITSRPALNILNYIYFYNGAGVATGDFNNDGLPDLYFTANQNQDKLYLNKGSFKFEDITKRAGINN